MMDRIIDRNATKELEHPKAPSTQNLSRAVAMRRVLKKKSYKEQQDMLKASRKAQKNSGDEAKTAKEGFESMTTPLPYKDEMERAFGRKLDDVKAHIGPKARDAAEEMGAEAYSVGKDVAFGKENPSKELVAHEVAHVVQQNEGVHKDSGDEESGIEKEADLAAKIVVSGGQVSSLKRDKTNVRKKEKLPTDFKKMWDAHPHNYQEDESQNTSSADILNQIGLPSNYNTCAIRLSIMLNKLGLKITPAKVKAAGITRAPYYSKNTKEYYILSAKEMWTYLTKNFRQPDKIFPVGKRYKNEEEFDKAFQSEIKPYIKSRKGIVAFDKIFGYSGTGHMDIFDGEKLSDAPCWYPSERIMLWIIEVPQMNNNL